MDDTNNKTVLVDNQVSPANTTPSHVGSAQKELPPISPTVESQISEIIAASEKQPSIDQEEREAGLERVPESPTLTEEHGAVGMRHAGASTPVLTQPPFNIDDVRAGLKISPTSSARWLAELGKRVLKMFGLWNEQ